MIEKLKRNGLILVGGFVVSIILTLINGVIGDQETLWDFKTWSNMLTYTGVAILAYGSYLAANFSNMFKKKKSINERYSPEEKEEKEEAFTQNLVKGWMAIGVGAILIILSIFVIRI